MIEILIVAIASFFAAGLTLYSGFGLGTIMLAVFALMFPIEVAIASTAIVHGMNNVFKVSMVGKHADRDVVIKFGVPAVIAAIIGASMMGLMAQTETVIAYQVFGQDLAVTPLKLMIALLMFGFALFELLPRFKALSFPRKYLSLGGVLSGFFGGFSGHQGALRSAFLAKSGLETNAFVGSNAVIGLSVDVIRILTYLVGLYYIGGQFNLAQLDPTLIGAAIAAAFCGVLVGKKFLHKVTIGMIQNITGTALLLIAFLLGFGVI